MPRGNARLTVYRGTATRAEVWSYAVLCLLSFSSRPSGISWTVRGPTELDVEMENDGPLDWRAMPGVIRALQSDPAHARARVILPETKYPDLAVVVAFRGEQLFDWVAIPRSAATVLRINASAGARVRVSVAGRDFDGRADAQGLALVQVEVPPGVDRVRAVDLDASGVVGPAELLLAAAPTRTEFMVQGADGANWIFRTDRSGRPSDALPPERAERIAAGVYRLPSPTARTNEADAPVAPPPIEAPARDGMLALQPDPMRSPLASAFHASAASTFGPSGKLGAALSLARSIPIARIELLAKALIAGGISSHEDASSELSGRRHVVAGGLVGEAAIPISWGKLVVSPSAGAGGAVAWRHLALGARAVAHWEAGPLATLALGVKAGPWALETRALVSLGVALGVESAPGLGWVGVARTWPL